MIKLILACLVCLCLTNDLLVSGASTNTTLVRNKRLFLQNPGYLVFPYNDFYYSWYNWHPAQFTVVPAVTTCSACPSACPGTCGTWSGLYACKCNSCPIGV